MKYTDISSSITQLEILEFLCVCVCVRAHALSRVRFFVTPCTVAHQAPLFMEFSRQEYWSGLSFLTPGHLPDPGIELASLMSPALIGRWNLYHSSPLGSPESA